MPQVDRFSVSLDTELLAAFDHHIAGRGYVNRSEAIRDMIRDLLLAERRRVGDVEVVGVLSGVCDHGAGSAQASLRDLLTRNSEHIVSQLGVPLDAGRDCMVLVLRGSAEDVEHLSDRIRAERGMSLSGLQVLPVSS